jgi:alpha-1,2-mannosyltransferase
MTTREPIRWSWAVLLTVAGLAVVVSVVRPLFLREIVTDLEVYRMGGRSLLDGESLYDTRFWFANMPFTYTPFAALVFVPLALLGSGCAIAVWTALSLGALLRACYLLAREAPAARPRTWSTGQAAVALFVVALFLEPVRKTTGLGQVNLVILWLVLEDVLSRRSSGWRGTALGVATGVKLVPGVFVPFLFLVDRRMEALRAAVAALATVGIGFVVAPDASWRYWTEIVFDAERVGGIAYVSNQSVTGVVERLTGPGERSVAVLAASVVVVVVGLVLGRALWREGLRLLGLSAVAVGALLGSPISWSHHWYWFLVAGVALVEQLRRSGSARGERTALGMLAATVLVALPSVVWWVPNEAGREYDHGGWELLAGNAYFLWAVAFLTYGVGIVVTSQRNPAAAPVMCHRTIVNGDALIWVQSERSQPANQEATMPDKDSGPEAGAKGVVEDVKGKAKEVVGNITGKEDLQNEGQAQQDKARSQRDVAEHEAKAEKARAESEANEARQRANE